MKKTGVIYKIENLVNGKVYVGQTVKKPKRRFQLHKSRLKRNIHHGLYLQNAWNKYGEDNFKLSMIEKCCIEDLDNREIYWIDHYKEKTGVYNLETGGNKNKTINNATKNQISNTVKDLWSEDKYYEKQLNNNLIQVICINTGKIYNSLTAAAKDLKVSINSIKLACEGKRNSVGGQKYGKPMQVAYYEENKDYKLKKIKNIKRAKKIICVNTKEIFNSMHKAAKKYNKYGCSQSKISMCCNGKREHNGRLENGEFIKWLFLEDYNSQKEYNFTKKPRRYNRAQKIKCINTGKIFNSITEAAKKLNIGRSTISYHCSEKGYGEIKHKDGYKLKLKYM
jgi:group I intron endonuclease